VTPEPADGAERHPPGDAARSVAGASVRPRAVHAAPVPPAAQTAGDASRPRPPAAAGAAQPTVAAPPARTVAVVRPELPAAEPPPVVEVHIGTIDVRGAAVAPVPSAPAAGPAFEGFAAYAGLRSYARAVRG
jgi:hypothetical protein